MKREILKEIGKFGFDLAKITFVIVILSIILKNGTINGYVLIGALTFAIGGVILIKG